MAYTWHPVASGPRALEDLSRMEFAGIQTNLNTEAANIARDENALRNWRASVERFKANALNAVNSWRQEQQRRIETMGLAEYQGKQREREWQHYGKIYKDQAKAEAEVKIKAATDRYLTDVEGEGETLAKKYGFAQDDLALAKLDAERLAEKVREIDTQISTLGTMKNKSAEAAKLDKVKTDLQKELEDAQEKVDRAEAEIVDVERSAALKGFEFLTGTGMLRHAKTKKEWPFGKRTSTSEWNPVVGELRLSEAY